MHFSLSSLSSLSPPPLLGGIEKMQELTAAQRFLVKVTVRSQPGSCWLRGAGITVCGPVSAPGCWHRCMPHPRCTAPKKCEKSLRRSTFLQKRTVVSIASCMCARAITALGSSTHGREPLYTFMRSRCGAALSCGACQ